MITIDESRDQWWHHILSTETEISFKTGALFSGNSLINFKTSFLETVSKTVAAYSFLP